jgi:hypothetical protein
MIGFKDSIGLSPAQVDSLQRLSDSLDARNAVVSDSLRAAIDRAGQRPDPELLFTRLRPYLQAGRQHTRDALEAARKVLSPEQWNKLPDALKRGLAGRRG